MTRDEMRQLQDLFRLAFSRRSESDFKIAQLLANEALTGDCDQLIDEVAELIEAALGIKREGSKRARAMAERHVANARLYGELSDENVWYAVGAEGVALVLSVADMGRRSKLLRDLKKKMGQRQRGGKKLDPFIGHGVVEALMREAGLEVPDHHDDIAEEARQPVAAGVAGAAAINASPTTVNIHTHKTVVGRTILEAQHHCCQPSECERELDLLVRDLARVATGAPALPVSQLRQALSAEARQIYDRRAR